MDQLDLNDIYRTFHPKTMNYTFFSSAHRAFSRIDHILGHNSSLGKLKKNWNHFKHLFWSQCGKIRRHPKEKKYEKAKCLPEESLQIAVNREVKGKGERERYTHLNAEFQKIARRDKKAFFSDQCKEIEENNRMRKTGDLY